MLKHIKFILQHMAAAMTLAAAFVPLHLQGQVMPPLPQPNTAAEYFKKAPAEAMALFDESTRLDMLDYFNSHMSTSSVNVLHGRSRIVVNAPQKLLIKVSKGSTIELDVIEHKKDSYIAVIETVHVPMAESGIRFYRSDWSELPTPPLPTYDDFIAKSNRKKTAKLEKPEMIFMAIEYDPEREAFRFKNTTAQYYTEYDTPEAVKLMLPEIYMKYDGKKFKAVK